MDQANASSSALSAARDMGALRVALIGYGEVGRIFAAALARAGVQSVTAYDVLVTDAARSQPAQARAREDGVVLCATAAEAVQRAHLVISAVTAAQARVAAGQIANHCAHGTYVLDVNSTSPQAKVTCAEMVARAGARYVEAAVMSAVPPYGIRAPMLLGGPHANAVLPMLAQLGFEAQVGAPTYGVVSAIKLCRSVVIKGMEALAIESFLTARRYGVEQEVIASLAETFPGLDWQRQATWAWQRVFQHGRRRAEEMREAAVTVAEAGIEPRMASATADVQAWIAQLRAEGVFQGAAEKPEWRDLADRIEREHKRSLPG